MDNLHTTTFVERTITVPPSGLFGRAVRLKFHECERCGALVARDGRSVHATFHLRAGVR